MQINKIKTRVIYIWDSRNEEVFGLSSASAIIDLIKGTVLELE